ncbi:MAG: DNRLRE domain-containing protein, partial [Bacteroidota bacterium]
MKNDLLKFCSTLLMMAVLSITAIAQPSRPENVTLVETTDRSVTITWDESTGNPGVASYNVYVNGELSGAIDMALFRGTEFQDVDINYHYDPPRTSIFTTAERGDLPAFTAYGLMGQTTYSMEVEAIDSTGAASPRSTALEATTEVMDITQTVLFPSYDTYLLGSDGNFAAAEEDNIKWDQSYFLRSRSRVLFDGWHVMFRNYMQFDLTELDDTENITSATLRLYYRVNSNQGQKLPFGIYEVSDETPIIPGEVLFTNLGANVEGNWKFFLLQADTIENRATREGLEITTFDADTSTADWKWINVDLTDHINAKVSEGDDLISFTILDPSVTRNYSILFRSADAPAFKPELVVNQTIVVSTEDFENRSDLKLYPNPLSEARKLSINFAEPGDYTVKILDTSGRQYLSQLISVEDNTPV